MLPLINTSKDKEDSTTDYEAILCSRNQLNFSLALAPQMPSIITSIYACLHHKPNTT